MNTSQIKTFAINSRKILKEGVINKISSLGFNPEGEPVFGLPQKIQGATIYAGKILDESFYDAWTALYDRIKAKGIKEVCEEAAYIWFNRLTAIRIMQKNGLIEPVLTYSSEELRIPRIVAQARAGHLMTRMKASDREKLDELLNDDSRTNEQFALLIENWCRYNPVIFNCFGGIEKYISILLPDNILVQGGFIDLLNHTSYITEEDYTKSELIGWLYQFYIAEKKDEVFDSFKKGRKAEAEDIPAATQIFTPNWIVKYMVQNTLGRTYLDNNPYSTLAGRMKYLVGDRTPDEAVCRLSDLTEYKLIDPACGSGHILVEAFDLFFLMYCEEGYSPRAAIENILTKNIIGIDLDTRAKQLATFALLMKAVKIDNSFLDCRVMPKVLDMPSPVEYPEGFTCCGEDAEKECREAFGLLGQAENLGSIMKFDMVSDDTRWAINRRVEEWKEQDTVPSAISSALPSFHLLLALTDRYTAVVANPPYMGSGNMNSALSRYVQEKYPEGKADLCTAFVQKFRELTDANGSYGFIIPPSWLFLSTFEGLRRKIIDEQSIASLLHLSRGVFGADFGSAASVIRNSKGENPKGCYFRLVERTFQEFDQDHLRILFEHTLADRDFRYRFKDYDKSVDELPYSEDGNRIFYPDVSQRDFAKIPGCPVGYWVSEAIISIYDNDRIKDFAKPIAGICTGCNDKYLRYWHEVNSRKISFEYNSYHNALEQNAHDWYFHYKGGTFRRWYGNMDYVLHYSKSSLSHMSQQKGFRHDGKEMYFHQGITWSKISSGSFSARLMESGCTFDSTGTSAFPKQNMLHPLLGLLNAKVIQPIINLVNPTMAIYPHDISNIPYVRAISDNSSTITDLVKDNISISRTDWDAHETSWDFKRNPLIEQQLQVFVDELSDTMPNLTVDEVGDFYAPDLMQPIEILCDCHKAFWEDLFRKLHHNEEELNRRFIEIYGLQDELTPDVPLEEITILQQGEISIENDKIVWHDDVIIKHFISYAIGCIMGRYRLDRPGLHIAYPNPSEEDLAPYTYAGQTVEIDGDGIIPLLSRDCLFEDNAYDRVVRFITTSFGERNLTENLNWIERCLGGTLESYLTKGFWRDHLKMYRNRPIYWLFSSKKGAFQTIAYMHRMNPYTVERIRTKYLLRHIDDLKNRISSDSERAALLSTQERRNLSKMQKDLDECMEYHDRLHVAADRQINFDLDDGVIVNYAKFGDVLAKIK